MFLCENFAFNWTWSSLLLGRYLIEPGGWGCPFNGQYLLHPGHCRATRPRAQVLCQGYSQCLLSSDRALATGTMSFLLRLARPGAEGRGHEPEIFRFAFIFFAKQCLRELGYCAPISSSKSYLSSRLNAKADASQKSFEGFKLEKETFLWKRRKFHWQ